MQALIKDGHVTPRRRDHRGRRNIGSNRATASRSSSRRWHPRRPKAKQIPLDILYEDDALIVIDKPAGLVVHPGAGNPTKARSSMR